jgi:SAM-dependent methyltransferase
MNIKRLRRHWDALGKSDPLWANLTNDDKRGGKWNADEFFLTGEQEIEEVLDFVGSLSVTFEHGRALDFGCGVGRLTQALAARFDEVWGVDIAPSMIEAANRYNRHPGTCHYYLNDRTDLARFDAGSFDFIYSNIVLQHMQPRDQRRNLAELVRVLAPGGIFVFQLPSAPLPRSRTEGWLAATQGSHQVHHPIVRPRPVPARASRADQSRTRPPHGHVGATGGGGSAVPRLARGQSHQRDAGCDGLRLVRFPLRRG